MLITMNRVGFEVIETLQFESMCDIDQVVTLCELIIKMGVFEWNVK